MNNVPSEKYGITSAENKFQLEDLEQFSTYIGWKEQYLFMID